MESIITSERARFERALRRVKGPIVRDGLRQQLSRTVDRFRAERIDAGEFRVVVTELTLEAEGMAAQQDRDADVWATIPTDGSGTPGRFARVLFGVTAAACLLVLGWVAALVWADATASERSAKPVGVSVVGIPAGPGTPDRDAARELIIEGAWLSWQAYTECGEGPAECDAILREINANPYGVHFFEDGSAVDPARN